jgi:peptidoglycan/LPS O-acetylase OafA/YrhL
VSKRIPQLDGVRGVAILLVILHNESSVFPSWHLERLFANGWMGVDLFFVLSGFLITGLLVDTRPSRRSVWNFYAKRCLRIGPLYYSLLLFMFVVVPLLRPSEAQALFERSSPWWAYPLFLQNFTVAVPTSAAGALAVTWSLAIEEQFYLLWPWMIRGLTIVQLRRLGTAVVCGSPLLRLYLSTYDVNLYTNVFCRLDGLMAGALLALAVRSNTFQPERFVGIAWAALVVAVPLAFATEADGARWIVFSLSAAASTAFVYLALFSVRGLLYRVLQNRFLVYTGTISYGLYLLHKIPFDAGKMLHMDRHPVLALPILLIASYALAAISWKLLEQPFLRLKRCLEAGSTSARPAKAA